jgi:uncharacterized glyoxalase superfamily protein PhnB
MTATALQARMMPSMTVNDLKKSAEFYKGLGFNVTEEYKDGDEVRGMMFEAGGACLGISQDDFAKGRDRVKGVGMRIYLETDQDIEALATQAKGAGVKLDSGPAALPWGPVGFSVTDPDGFKLTISQPSK